MLSFSPVVRIGTPPTPHPQASVPPFPGSGGRGTLVGERGVGRVPIPTRDVHCGSLYIYVLCAPTPIEGCRIKKVRKSKEVLKTELRSNIEKRTDEGYSENVNNKSGIALFPLSVATSNIGDMVWLTIFLTKHGGG